MDARALAAISRQCLAAGLACALGLSPALAQQSAIEPVESTAHRYLRPYTPREVPAVRLANSSRLAGLMRAGKLYLTAQDAVALALENNIDLEVARYSPITAALNVTRAQAGGALPGVPSGASQAGSVASGQGVLGSQAAAGVSGGGNASTASRGGGNASITQIGPVTQNLDPTIQQVTTFSHKSYPQSNSRQSLIDVLVQNGRTYTTTLQQGLLSGGAVTLSYSNHYLNENAPSDVLNPSNATSLSLSFQHHLLQGFGVAMNARNITVAKMNVNTSELNFRTTVIATVNGTLNTYFSLVAALEDRKAKRNALEVAQKFYTDSQRQVELGALPGVDLIAAESQIATARQALVDSETTARQSQVRLKNLISRNGLTDPLLSAAEIVPLDRLIMPDSDNLPPLKDLVTAALANRSDLAARQAAIKTAEISSLGTRSALKPVLVAFGGASTQGLAGTPRVVNGQTADPYFDGGVGSATAMNFRRNFPSQNIGLYFQTAINNRQAQADFGIDQLQMRQTQLGTQKELNQAHVDVMNAVVAIEQARARYSAAVKNRELAEKLLSSEQKKFQLGASTPFAVIQQQRGFITADAAVSSALVAYNSARLSLDQTTGSTLEANHVAIAEAHSGVVSRVSSAPPAN